MDTQLMTVSSQTDLNINHGRNNETIAEGNYTASRPNFNGKRALITVVGTESTA